MNGLALCSGIGGLELGLSQAIPGYRTVCHVEKDPYAAAVLATRIEAGDLFCAPVYSDIRGFDGSPWRGVVDLISAGYPCQPYSWASHRGVRSTEDDPKTLWPEVLRIICEVGPRAVFLENVPAHLQLGFSGVLGGLARAGFACEWGVFSASEVGAVHRRPRLFVLAYANSEGKPLIPKHEEVAGLRVYARPIGWGEVPASVAVGRDDGVPSRMDRLKCLGNAVVPAQADHAFRELYSRIWVAS